MFSSTSILSTLRIVLFSQPLHLLCVMVPFRSFYDEPVFSRTSPPLSDAVVMEHRFHINYLGVSLHSIILWSLNILQWVPKILKAFSTWIPIELGLAGNTEKLSFRKIGNCRLKRAGYRTLLYYLHALFRKWPAHANRRHEPSLLTKLVEMHYAHWFFTTHWAKLLN